MCDILTPVFPGFHVYDDEAAPAPAENYAQPALPITVPDCNNSCEWWGKNCQAENKYFIVYCLYAKRQKNRRQKSYGPNKLLFPSAQPHYHLEQHLRTLTPCS